MSIVDIGCGENKYVGDNVIGIDKVDLPGVDIIHDMEVFPYPIDDDSFDKVVMIHSLEHVSPHNNANIKIIEEIYRLLKTDGILMVQVPTGHGFHYDPTHKNHVGYWYWKYFSTDFALNYYTHARFELVSAELIQMNGFPYINHFTYIFKWLYKITPPGIERFINFIGVDAAIQYTLQKV